MSLRNIFRDFVFVYTVATLRGVALALWTAALCADELLGHTLANSADCSPIAGAAAAAAATA